MEEILKKMLAKSKVKFKIILDDEGLCMVRGNKIGIMAAISLLISSILSDEKTNITKKDIDFAVNLGKESVNEIKKEKGNEDEEISNFINSLLSNNNHTM